MPTLSQMSNAKETEIAQTELQISGLQQKIADADKHKQDLYFELNNVNRERAGFEREFTNAQSRLTQYRKTQGH